MVSFNRSGSTFLALAFRGTETDSIKDIKAGAKIKLMQCKTGGKIHTGFNDAFDVVERDIQTRINDEEFRNSPLFITGHSLGGALATIAAKKLKHSGGIAACYTFGSPRVGNEEWIADIKTPIYRVVNAADCITMLPLGDEFITCLSWVLRLLTLRSLNRRLVSNAAGYIHCGDMRYMTNCKKGQYEDVELIYSVSLFHRIKGWAIKKFPWNKPLADHSIRVYRRKLMVIAKRRNKLN